MSSTCSVESAHQTRHLDIDSMSTISSSSLLAMANQLSINDSASADSSAELRVGTPYLCALPARNFCIPPDHEFHDFLRRNLYHLTKDIADILHRYGIDWSRICPCLRQSIVTPEHEQFPALFITAHSEGRGASWAAAASSILRYLHDLDLQPITVEIVDPRVHGADAQPGRDYPPLTFRWPWPPGYYDYADEYPDDGQEAPDSTNCPYYFLEGEAPTLSLLGDIYTPCCPVDDELCEDFGPINPEDMPALYTGRVTEERQIL